jgi:hypothetical protein
MTIYQSEQALNNSDYIPFLPFGTAFFFLVSYKMCIIKNWIQFSTTLY